MRKGVRRSLFAVLGVVLVVGAAIGGYAAGIAGWGSDWWAPETKQATNSAPVPTLFVHGYGGVPASSDTLIARIEAAGYGQKSLRATVSADGSVTFSGTWDKSAKQPLVQVIFKDNRNGDYHRSAEWLATILDLLHARYGVTQFNAVAHSLGNNAVLYYVATHAKAAVQLHKLVDIASYVNTGNEADEVAAAGDVNEHFQANVERRLADQKWYQGSESPFNGRKFDALNIYGSVKGDETGDGQVTVPMAQGLRRVFAGISGTYAEREFTGKNAQHSALTRRNPGVAQAAADFLRD